MKLVDLLEEQQYKYPPFKVGHLYRADEISEWSNKDDLKGVDDHQDDQGDLEDHDLHFVYELLDIKVVEHDPWGKLKSDDDVERIEKIKKTVEKEHKLWCIFVDPQDNYVIEGRHRLAAYHELGIKKIPALLVEKVKK